MCIVLPARRYNHKCYPSKHTLDLVFLEFNIVTPNRNGICDECLTYICLPLYIRRICSTWIPSFSCRASLTCLTVFSGSKLKFDLLPVKVLMNICIPGNGCLFQSHYVNEKETLYTIYNYSTVIFTSSGNGRGVFLTIRER
jgi:hypothetical protein